jgi:hypothetical protein
MRRVLALLSGVMLLSGCGVPGGVEVEGLASQVSPPPSTSPLPSGTPASTDAVAVLRADPLVNPELKSVLMPCSDGSYPIDQRYLDVTGDGRPELVVTVNRCLIDEKLAAEAGATRPLEQTDANGLPVIFGYAYAAFVYDLETDPPTQLFGVEDSDIEVVQGTEDRRGLILIRQQWAPEDDPCCPTDQRVTLYLWDGTTFVEEPR